MSATLVTLAIGGTAQAAIAAAWLAARRRDLPRRSGDFFRLSGIVQGFLTGSLIGDGSWWAVVPAALGCGFAWAAITEPKRHARPAAPIHADRNTL